MSKRSGQSGSVRLVGSKWYGRYWRDVPGKDTREHPSVIFGEKFSMTKPEAKRKLMDLIAAEGVNTPRLRPICKRLGIAHGGMHAFRHGRVGHMRVNAIPDDFVKSQVGHSSLRITSQCTHFEHKQKREMAERLLSCTQNGNLYSTVN